MPPLSLLIKPASGSCNMRCEYCLTVISAANARRARQIYEYFKKSGYRYQQYIECLDPIGEPPGGRAYSLTPEKYATFLKQLFDSWYLDMSAGRYVYNRYFENLVEYKNNFR